MNAKPYRRSEADKNLKKKNTNFDSIRSMTAHSTLTIREIINFNLLNRCANDTLLEHEIFDSVFFCRRRRRRRRL